MSHRFEIRQTNDESFEVSLDGQHIISVNHDAHGWDGMDAVRKVVDRVAGVLNAEVVDIEGSDEAAE